MKYQHEADQPKEDTLQQEMASSEKKQSVCIVLVTKCSSVVICLHR